MIRPLAALMTLFLICTGTAAEPALGSLEWFGARLDSPETPTRLDGYYIEFTERKWPVEGDEATLEDLRARVEGKPEHPDRRTMERLEAQLELEGFLWRYRIWYQDEDNWRVSIDTDDPDVIFTFHDRAMRETDEIWTWIRDSLTVMDSGSMPDGRNPESALIHLHRFVLYFIDVSISAQHPSVSPVESRVDGDRWFGIAESDDGTRQIHYEGRVADNGHTVEILTATHTAHPNKRLTGFTRSYDNWTDHSTINKRIPSVIRDTYGNGDRSAVYTLIDIRPLEEEEIEYVTRLPDPIAGTDAVRDAGTIREIVDRRPGKGIVTDAVSGEPVGDLPARGTGSTLGQYYWLLWIAAGLVLAVLVWYRVRR